MERDALLRLKIMLSRTKQVIESYIRRTESHGQVEGKDKYVFDDLKSRVEEMEEILNG